MTLAPVTDPTEVRRMVREEREKFLAVLGRVREVDVGIGGVEGEWSCLDILGHVEYWDEQALTTLGLIAEGRADEIARPQSDDAVDAINAREAAERKGMTYGQLRAQYDHLALQVDARLLAVSREELEGQVGEETVADLVAVDTYVHYEQHRESIEAWLARR